MIFSEGGSIVWITASGNIDRDQFLGLSIEPLNAFGVSASCFSVLPSNFALHTFLCEDGSATQPISANFPRAGSDIAHAGVLLDDFIVQLLTSNLLSIMGAPSASRVAAEGGK